MKKAFNVVVAATFSIVAAPALAQDSHSLDLAVNHVGISIGDSRRVTGLRINFRDRYLDEVNGVNVTAWQPYREPRGEVHGIAVGLPMTGARRIDGLAVGIFGVAADERIRGISIGGIGMGAGNDIEGIAIGGIGMGVGRDIKGIAIGGIGMGTGGSLKGLGVGGIGVGIGGSGKGVLIGGVGAGVGNDFEGLSVGGIGVGAGNRLKGLSIAGVGVGAGGDVTGVQVAGIGIGSGGTLKYVSIAGIGIGARRIEGLAISPGMGAEQTHGLMIAPIYFKIPREGTANGVNISAYNDVRGTQQGLAIGLFNYARELDGVQIGILNYAANKRSARLLPLFNYHKS